MNSCTANQVARHDNAYKCFYCLSDSRLSAEHHWQETEQQLLLMETQRNSKYINELGERPLNHTHAVFKPCILRFSGETHRLR